MADYDYLFKCIIVGDGGCGKTAVVVRFSQGFFKENYKLTIGVEFAVKDITLKDNIVKLQIWDTGGQDRFQYVRPLYYKGAMGCIVLFDVTNRESFEHIPRWLEEVGKEAGKIPMLLVGNKIDLINQRVIDTEEAQQLATDLGMEYMESSAKSGEGVSDIFAALAFLMMGESIPESYLNFESKESTPVEDSIKHKKKPKPFLSSKISNESASSKESVQSKLEPQIIRPIEEKQQLKKHRPKPLSLGKSIEKSEASKPFPELKKREKSIKQPKSNPFLSRNKQKTSDLIHSGKRLEDKKQKASSSEDFFNILKNSQKNEIKTESDPSQSQKKFATKEESKKKNEKILSNLFDQTERKNSGKVEHETKPFIFNSLKQEYNDKYISQEVKKGQKSQIHENINKKEKKMEYCPNCKAKLNVHFKFCHKCGKRIK